MYPHSRVHFTFRYALLCAFATGAALAPTCLAQQAGTVTVSAQCNIYGAGHATPPRGIAPGPGILPIRIDLPAGISRYVEISLVLGQVGANFSAGGMVDNDGNHPAAGIQSTNPMLGISGIVAERKVFFLTGVFVTSAEPQNPAPERLTFANYDFAELRPLASQLFFIGDGRGGNGVTQRFYAPNNATRLYLGFIDVGSDGLPGFYSDNTGSFQVSYSVSTDASVIGSVLDIRRAYEIVFGTEQGKTYQVQFTGNLESPSWTDIGNAVAGDGGQHSIFDAASQTPQRFYRVRITQ